jgi:2'-5' RNA ligase
MPPRINVALLPSPEIVAHVTHVADHLRMHAGVDAFLHRGCLPHCTLYMTRYPEDHVGAIVDACRALAPQLRSVSLAITALRWKGDWLMLDVARDAALAELAALLTDRLSPLHAEGQPPPSWLGAEEIARREAHARFGSASVGPHYAPHVTVAHTAIDERVAAWWARPETQAFAQLRVAGAGLTLSVAQADDDGQFVASLARFALDASA